VGVSGTYRALWSLRSIIWASNELRKDKLNGTIMAQSAFGTRIGFVTLSQQFFSCLFLGILVDALQRLNSHSCTSRKNTSKPVNCLQTTTIIFYLSLTFPSGFVFFRITPKATCTTRLLPWTASSSSTHSQRQNLGTPYPVRTSCNSKARGVITGAHGATTARGLSPGIAAG
jgi:hypothetical protein